MSQNIVPQSLETDLLLKLKEASLNYDSVFDVYNTAQVLGVKHFGTVINVAKSIEKKIGTAAELKIGGNFVHFYIKRPVGQHPEVEDLKNYFEEKVREEINNGKHLSVIDLGKLAYDRGEPKDAKSNQKLTLAKNLLVYEMWRDIESIPSGNSWWVKLKH